MAFRSRIPSHRVTVLFASCVLQKGDTQHVPVDRTLQGKTLHFFTKFLCISLFLVITCLNRLDVFKVIFSKLNQN